MRNMVTIRKNFLTSTNNFSILHRRIDFTNTSELLNEMLQVDSVQDQQCNFVVRATALWGKLAIDIREFMASELNVDRGQIKWRQIVGKLDRLGFEPKTSSYLKKLIPVYEAVVKYPRLLECTLTRKMLTNNLPIILEICGQNEVLWQTERHDNEEYDGEEWTATNFDAMNVDA